MVRGGGGMSLLIWTPAALWVAAVSAGIRALVRQRRPVEYRGRHRARLLSTMERNMAAAYVAARAVAAMRPPVGPAGLHLSRGESLPVPAPRSPWATPEWLDEWTAEHEAVAA